MNEIEIPDISCIFGLQKKDEFREEKDVWSP